MSSLERLARLFASYGLYSNECYQPNKPFRIAQELFSSCAGDRYSREIEQFLAYQQYRSKKRGVDLPWWGADFFTKQKGFRTMIIGPHSKTPDAGSVVFFSNLTEYLDDKMKYDQFAARLTAEWQFPYRSWKQLQNQLDVWGIERKFLYITDCAKVYKEGSWTHLDRKSSKDLLYREIEICEPDLIVLLGAVPLELLRDDISYTSVAGRREYLIIGDFLTVVSPYPAGNGFSQPNFHQRLDNATDLILAARKQWQNG